MILEKYIHLSDFDCAIIFIHLYIIFVHYKIHCWLSDSPLFSGDWSGFFHPDLKYHISVPSVYY